ncbi:hypothetical protein UPYG_G00338630 [Umbra pygmaea]|uniref:TNFR-Cys domain-containing protein n=1 Tax=Umbra pygmaea TaxID=75934 RepID=A0ABD0WIA0_UMBPY
MLVITLMLISAHASVALQGNTFKKDDAHSGRSLVCDSCPPGTYLRASCSATQKTDCAKCPAGSFTEVWNYISKCLRCSMCAENQVVKEECSSSKNCKCECKSGYYFNQKLDTCIKHKECPIGYGVKTTGTPERDTECEQCQSGFYSDVGSAKTTCIAHTQCDDGGFHLVLKGKVWHDTLCASCLDLKTRDGAEYVREILPAFFTQLHQTMHIRKMRRLVMKLPQMGGEKLLRGAIFKLSRMGLIEYINRWIRTTVANDQIKKLPDILKKIGALHAGRKLKRDLEYIEKQSELCKS